MLGASVSDRVCIILNSSGMNRNIQIATLWYVMTTQTIVLLGVIYLVTK